MSYLSLKLVSIYSILLSLSASIWLFLNDLHSNLLTLTSALKPFYLGLNFIIILFSFKISICFSFIVFSSLMNFSNSLNLSNLSIVVILKFIYGNSNSGLRVVLFLLSIYFLGFEFIVFFLHVWLFLIECLTLCKKNHRDNLRTWMMSPSSREKLPLLSADSWGRRVLLYLSGIDLFQIWALLKLRSSSES